MSKAPIQFPYGVRLTIAYDGTDFHGWQTQEGQRTVQETIEEAITKMGMAHSTLRGCSRTDSGVHARRQIAAFACDRELPDRGWTLGLNGILPPDVAIVQTHLCDRRYNPRWDAEKKLYRYLINVGDTRDPLLRRYAWHIGPRLARPDVTPQTRGFETQDFLDIDAMQRGAELLQGQHDFHAFRAYSDKRRTTVRTMFAVRVLPGWNTQSNLLAIEVEGNAFMKNMVRIMVGTLMDIGRRRFPPEQIPKMLAPEGKRKFGGPTAPPEGLTLVEIQLKHGDYVKKREAGKLVQPTFIESPESKY